MEKIEKFRMRKYFEKTGRNKNAESTRGANNGRLNYFRFHFDSRFQFVF